MGKSYEKEAEQIISSLERLNRGIVSLRQGRVESVPW